ncbi:hypothetical protein QBC38DRAFT_481530 [Podospora fimiseda]|uniref:Uncharacterized protein n=1 Tax=Podospora fimiseda TaxID=252190 RepID=A0AAN7BM40_9PEZI|nr:hypothetical protein QBC38DRAFT_481530 [Podospora fimiseda]
MASKLQIHKPYVLQTLPAPFSGPDGPGSQIAGEVFGQKQGLKRKKRSELAVAIDGVAVYIYDILTAQQVTSYDVPTHASFTCPPFSLRWRPTSGKTASRYTYAATVPSKYSAHSKREIKLFKEDLSESGTTNLTTKAHVHKCDAPIIHLFAGSPRSSRNSLPSDALPNHDLIAIASDGTVLGLNGETLEERWHSSPTVLAQELGSKAGLQVEFAQATSAADVVDGLFGGNNELFGVFQEKVHRDGFNPDILVIITSLKTPQASIQQHLHILALPSDSNKANVISVFVAPLPKVVKSTKYQFDVRSGSLQTLSDGLLLSFTFSNGIPRLENQLQVPDMGSFIRLSKTSVLTATPQSFSIYNPIYRSLQAATSVESQEICQFVGYLASREIAVGIRGSSLLAIQIEAPKGRTTKRRAEGLLTDAIRRGIPRDQSFAKRIRAEHPSSAILAEPLPSVMSDAATAEWQEGVAKADEFLGAGDVRSWEELLAAVFKVKVKPGEVNGDAATSNLPEWVWPSSRAEYPHVDRRWIFYAISRVFGWEEHESEAGTTRLVCRLPESSVLNYLVDAGHLTTSNIKSSFKDETREVDEVDKVIGEELPVLLSKIDPTTELLLGYLSGTPMGPTELVSAVKLLLHSLDLFADPSKPRVKAIKETSEDMPEEENEAIKMELDRAEEELQITEFHLGGHRFRGLSVAFGKLAACPASATVESLRRLFKPDETIGLLNVLRAELIKDGWTSDISEDIEAPPDGSLQLIAELMIRCIDAVGLGGWMAFDTVLSGSEGQDDAADYFERFNSEIDSALHCISQAMHLQGMLAETVSYAKRARKALVDASKGKTTIVQRKEYLPFGLKTDSRISMERVRSGGEVVARSARDIGRFLSQRRGIYSINRNPEESVLGRSNVTVVCQEAQ